MIKEKNILAIEENLQRSPGRRRQSVTPSIDGLRVDQSRWFDSSTGRWIIPDPTGFTAGDTNEYRYVGNSPANGVDPTGMSSWWIKTTDGTVYSGSGSPSLLDALKVIDEKHKTIDLMILKGHGYSGGITEGWFSNEHLIEINMPETRQPINVYTKTGGPTNVRSLLGGITNSKTKIFLNGCFTDELAKDLSSLLPGVSVRGSTFFVIDVKIAEWPVGSGEWMTYVNGKEDPPPRPKPYVLPPYAGF